MNERGSAMEKDKTIGGEFIHDPLFEVNGHASTQIFLFPFYWLLLRNREAFFQAKSGRFCIAFSSLLHHFYRESCDFFYYSTMF